MSRLMDGTLFKGVLVISSPKRNTEKVLFTRKVNLFFSLVRFLLD